MRARSALVRLALFVTLSALPATTIQAEGDQVNFNRDIRPILSDRCFTCHGPDENQREAELRLDLRDAALEAAIVPGDAKASELIARVSTTDADERMPPIDSRKPPLSDSQVELLRRWIDQGAEYSQHWAFLAPQRPPLPPVENEAWVRNPIDRFVLARLGEEKLTPSPAADRTTLIRRVSLDLTGLPPSPQEVEEFVGDASPDAYEKVVDRLLASDHYGEHQARYWLDGARYADTNGYQYDKQRTQWPWRDWVIRALNTNMPFDQFTVEQLAGDLLPDATAEQRLATGFNRNHPITIEGGVIDEEYRTEYVMDRVVTTSTVWMGLTLMCARCHEHKFDPISQKEFYQFFAFFNQVPERGLSGFAPQLQAPLVLEPDSQAKGPNVLVMADKPGIRSTYVLYRGQYDHPIQDQPVQPNVPAILPSLPEGLPPNRLALAQWLVDGRHPLTARVTVNRFWQRLFGTGIVKTSENFGIQSEWPSHPELLDWLAVEFVEGGWDVKAMRKLIVMSATYRQSSRATAESMARDPENRLLARGPRLRLDAEVIRDSALYVSGLLDTKLGGPPVYPYHPQGLWLEINNRPNYSRAYPHQTDPAQHYRRSLYTYWKRTVPPPSLAAFDAPEREFCIVRRSRTNTPLQAFVLLHDPQFVEAARFLAERMMTADGSAPEDRLAFGFQLVTARGPSPQELAVLNGVLAQRLAQYRGDPEMAQKVLSAGLGKRNEAFDPAEHAAYATVARILLNLSEFVTKD